MPKLVIFFFSTTFALTLGVSYYKYYQVIDLQQTFENQKQAYQKQVASLKNEIESLEEMTKNSTTKDLSSSNNIPAKLTSSKQITEETVAEPRLEKLSKPDWEAKLSLRKIEERLALTQSEHSELEEKFKAGEKLSVLASVIGEERAKSFFDEEAKTKKIEEEEEIKEQLFKLTRVLNLNSDQESKVLRVLTKTRESRKTSYAGLQEQQDHAMELHSDLNNGAPNSGDELRAVYEEYRVELEKVNSSQNSILTKQLKKVLSEEQLNKLLEYQATKQSGLQ